MPEVFTQTAPVIKEETPAVQAPVVKTEESLVSRASKVSLDKPTEGVKSTPEESIKLDQATIDKITDPALKAAVTEAHKSMQADYTRKTQDLALRRKEMDSLKTQLEQSGQYTPTKIQEMLANPSFVQAAQEYQRINGGQTTTATNGSNELTADEFSYLSPEQQKLYISTQEVKKTNDQILSKLNASETARAFEQQDTTLKSKYGNYNPSTVDEIYNGMMNGKIQATREHLWKVADYDSAVERAYKLGLEDRKVSIGEKVNASSPQTNGVTVTPSGDTPVKMTNESGPEYFKRIAAHNFAKIMKKS